MKKILFILLFFTSFICVGCSSVTTTGEIVDVTVPSNNNTPIDNNIRLTEEEKYEKLFSLDEKITIYINIDSKQLQLIEDDYQKYSNMGSKSPIYRKCNITITIGSYSETIEEVGIRMKGNTSRKSFYDNGINELIHFKLSFSETFDDEKYYSPVKEWSENARKERKNRTFATLEKLDMKWNKCYDQTHVREIYAYDLFRQNGLISPHANICEVKIDNLSKIESLGIYTIYEPVDKLFINRVFKEDVNDLYKIGWGLTEKNGTEYSGGTLTMDTITSIGIEDEDKIYFPIYDLKTNKKKSDHSCLKELMINLNNNDVSNVDLDYFEKFMAVSYLLGNPDDYRAHYNNYYIYFVKVNDELKAIFIPNDYDRTLGITKEWNPGSNAMTEYDKGDLYTTDLGENVNPLIKYVLNNIESKNRYYMYLKDISESTFFSFDTFKTYFDKAKRNYENCKPTINTIIDYHSLFSLEESNNMDRTDVNLSIELYFNKIKKASK